jgi:hypothetical protein
MAVEKKRDPACLPVLLTHTLSPYVSISYSVASGVRE